MVSKKEIETRDAKRNIGEELLQAIKDVKGGNHGAIFRLDYKSTMLSPP